MRFTTNDVEMLKSAANELDRYINSANDEIRKTITSQTGSEPDYHDHQTCYELALLAKRINKQLNNKD